MSTEISTPRSPRYPRLSLADAIIHARRLYDGAHRSELDTHTAYRVLGYAGKTGASATVLGALRQYALVRGLRSNVAVSDLALRIFEPETLREYVDAIAEAAESPEAFRAIYGQFGTGVPKSDEAIRSFLIRTLGFSKAGAEDCIRSFRESQSQVDSERRRILGEESEIAEAATETRLGDSSRTAELTSAPIQLAKPEVNNAIISQNSEEFIRVPLAKDCVAELRFQGRLSTNAIDRLLAYIQLMKPIWAEGDAE